MTSWISIARPQNAPDHPQRSIECQRALQAAFRDFRARAEKSGWDRREIAWAVMLLAGEELKSLNEGKSGAGSIGTASSVLSERTALDGSLWRQERL